MDTEISGFFSVDDRPNVDSVGYNASQGTGFSLYALYGKFLYGVNDVSFFTFTDKQGLGLQGLAIGVKISKGRNEIFSINLVILSREET